MIDMELYSWYSQKEKSTDPTKKQLERAISAFKKKHSIKPNILIIRETDVKPWMGKPSDIRVAVASVAMPTTHHFFLERYDMSKFERSARQLLKSGLILSTSDPNLWRVESSTTPGLFYDVKWRNVGGSCTCRGFQFRHWCKHMEAIHLIKSEADEEKPLLDEIP